MTASAYFFNLLESATHPQSQNSLDHETLGPHSNIFCHLSAFNSPSFETRSLLELSSFAGLLPLFLTHSPALFQPDQGSCVYLLPSTWENMTTLPACFSTPPNDNHILYNRESRLFGFPSHSHHHITFPDKQQWTEQKWNCFHHAGIQKALETLTCPVLESGEDSSKRPWPLLTSHGLI